MLTEMLEAAWPGKWTVIKRRERTNVYPSPQPGYEIQCPPGQVNFAKGTARVFGASVWIALWLIFYDAEGC